MLKRSEVFFLIETERAYQDGAFDPSTVLSSGLTRMERDKDVTAGLLLLETYVRKAEAAWANQKNGSNLKSLQQVAKIAALAVSILERAGGSELLLTNGLR